MENKIKDGYNLTELILEIISSTIYNEDLLKSFKKIKAYNKELYLHSINVAFLSMLMGMQLYTSKNELEELFIAALLHDYGKLYVSKDIMEKADVLTTDERLIIELHSAVGFFYLKQETNFSNNILFAVLDHHEKVNGSGYGHHKKADKISQYAKIISIVDVYDAMTSDRVYRKRIDKNAVKEYIAKMAGTYFDKKLSELFIQISNKYDIEHMEKVFRKNIESHIAGAKSDWASRTGLRFQT